MPRGIRSNGSRDKPPSRIRTRRRLRSHDRPPELRRPTRAPPSDRRSPADRPRTPGTTPRKPRVPPWGAVPRRIESLDRTEGAQGRSAIADTPGSRAAGAGDPSDTRDSTHRRGSSNRSEASPSRASAACRGVRSGGLRQRRHRSSVPARSRRFPRTRRRSGDCRALGGGRSTRGPKASVRPHRSPRSPRMQRRSDRRRNGSGRRGTVAPGTPARKPDPRRPRRRPPMARTRRRSRPVRGSLRRAGRGADSARRHTKAPPTRPRHSPRTSCTRCRARHSHRRKEGCRRTRGRRSTRRSLRPCAFGPKLHRRPAALNPAARAPPGPAAPRTDSGPRADGRGTEPGWTRAGRRRG